MVNNKDLNAHIFNIIQDCKIKEQKELQDYLAQRGYNIPQATLSRRLKKLSIEKLSGEYKVTNYNQQPLPTILNIRTSDSGLIVLHTNPGYASCLAFFIDKKYVSYSPQDQKKSLILGSIAGDDTVLLILKNKDSLEEVMKLLKNDFPYLDHKNK